MLDLEQIINKEQELGFSFGQNGGKAMIGNRVGLIVWLQHLKYSRQLRKFGNIYYISKKMRYAILYCDESNQEQVISKLKSQHYVKDVQFSHLQDLKTVYNKKKSYESKQEEVIL